MARQFNEPRTKRPTFNASVSLVLKQCHSERSRLPRRSHGEGGRNLLLLTARMTRHVRHSDGFVAWRGGQAADFTDCRLSIFRDGAAALTGFQIGANYSSTLSQSKQPPRGEAGRLIARYCCLYRPFSGKYTLSLLLH